MKTIQQAFVIATMGMLAGCGGVSPDQSSSSKDMEIGTATQDITVVDCQKAAATCVQGAKSFTDIITCSTKLQSCTIQAAKDLATANAPFKDCRTQSDACIKGALTVSDISACRKVFDSCTAGVGAAVDNVLSGPISDALGVVDEAVKGAEGVLTDELGAADTAFGAITACQTSANTCIKGALKTADISGCQATFTTCLSGAVNTIDAALKPLPVPSLTDIQKDFAACQDQTTSCLVGALTFTSTAACDGNLQTCVKGATTVADTTVSDINKILPPGITLPVPTAAVDCTTSAAQCLQSAIPSLLNPFPLENALTCATKATACLTSK